MSDDQPTTDEQRRIVRERYADIATDSSNCCESDSCSPSDRTRELGYDDEEIDAVSEGANLGLGCGNPTAIAELTEGETVLDLGSGAGFDCFHLGEIEHLPVADESVDVIISNCVINLSPDKQQVFADAFRVLRPGGRLAISDVVQTAPFPEELHDDPEALAACVAGAATIEELERMLDIAGFDEISITPKDDSRSFIRSWDETRDLSEYLLSSVIEARKS